jgi:hypothetical protein
MEEEEEELPFKSRPLHHLASFSLRLRLTVHGYGAKNTASKHIKSDLFKVLRGQEEKKNELLLTVCMR